MAIEKALVLSTAHMPNADPHWGDAVVVDFEHGHILLFNRHVLDEKMVPPWLLTIFQKAGDEKCSYIVFDCDASRDDNLEQWDW
jgi:hypothetical protein